MKLNIYFYTILSIFYTKLNKIKILFIHLTLKDRFPVSRRTGVEDLNANMLSNIILKILY